METEEYQDNYFFWQLKYKDLTIANQRVIVNKQYELVRQNREPFEYKKMEQKLKLKGRVVFGHMD
jgi:hypothetical protein